MSGPDVSSADGADSSVVVTPPATSRTAGSARSGGRAATVVFAGILISRLTGLGRGFVFAHFFGAGFESDAYGAAIKIPNLLRTLLGEGAMSASFVPVYSRLLAKGDERGARALAGAILGLLMVVVSALTLVGILAAPLLTAMLTLGWDEEKRAFTTQLTRIMFPMTACMVLSGWCLGVQNSHRRFFWSYASAALWNIAQIVLLVGWGAHAGSKLQLAVWLAWATLVGSVLQVAAQMPEVLRLVHPLRITLNRAAEGVGQSLRNVVPVVTALSVVQLSSFIDMSIASILPNAAVSNLNYANTIVLLPVALFGVSVAASSLPEFSRESDQSTTDALLERLRGGWQRILFYIVPSTIVLIAFGDLCVGLVYRSGKFGAPEQRAVHLVLAAFAVGLVSYSSVKLLSQAYYALHDYRTPLRASMTSLVVSATISLALVWPLRHSLHGAAAIALGTALGSYVNLLVLTRGLRTRLGPLYNVHMRHGTQRIVIAATVAAAVAAPVRAWLFGSHPWIAGPPTLGVFALTYLVVAWRMGSGEAARLLRQAPRLHPSPA